MSSPSVAIIGGGAGGCFCAIETKRLMPQAKITLFEKSQSLLSKVRISGGGRCNVTHAQFDPHLLSLNYPRGRAFLLPLFHRFQPKDMVEWLRREGISLIAEEDGRMFPDTHSSETIISCFCTLMNNLGVEIRKGIRITDIESENSSCTPSIFLKSDSSSFGPFDAVVIATGSTPASLAMLQNLNLEIAPQVPSLFTFNCPKSPFLDLAGVSVNVSEVLLPDLLGKRKERERIWGPILITHWGFSGPAILKASSFYARELAEKEYRTDILIDWAPLHSSDDLLKRMLEARKQGKKLVKNHPILSEIPKSLFERLYTISGGNIMQSWSEISNTQAASLTTAIKATRLSMEGKTTYKNEFVTAGGVNLNQITPKTMASKLYPWLFFTGEVVDIDGITGGFNFQAAWTTAWITSRGIAERALY